LPEPYDGERSIGVIEVAGDEYYCQDGVAAEKASYLDTTNNNFESALGKQLILRESEQLIHIKVNELCMQLI
jgi:hypothetical protein